MTREEEMKKIIKPLVKECIKEILYEEGMMKIMQENVQKQQKVAARQVPQENYEVKEKKFIQENVNKPKISIEEAKKKLLKEIAMDGFDPFIGTIPNGDSKSEMHEDISEQKNKVLPGINGSGIDISGLMGANGKAWKFYNNALNNGEKE